MKHKIKYLKRGDLRFPKNLENLPDCPDVIYVWGNADILNDFSLAIVGSRNCSEFGRIFATDIAQKLNEKNIVIVSGLAYGVDSIAHRECLEAGGQTIAVLGGGFDHIYPAEHEGLANQIAEKGLLLSEYRPKMIATKYSFPTRNRIVAGLCDGLLITEASIKSGTIHTKDFALDYGRNMYAVPGNIDSQSSALTNQIIKCGQAELVTDANDILKDYQVSKANNQQTMFDFSNLNDEEKEIVKILSSGMKTIDEIAKNSKLSINILNTYLTTLEISAIIKRMPGGYFALV